MGGWLVLTDNGPLWFKGATEWDEAARGADMAAVLDAQGVQRMVVGHASGPNKHIHARFDGRVVVASSPMSDDPWAASSPAALEISNDGIAVVTASGRSALVAPQAERKLTVAAR
jgi:hypothetical protein